MAEVVAAGLFVPEGPTVLADGQIAFVEQVAGRVSVFDRRRVEPVAHLGGSPNAAVAGADGWLYVCQNGGVVGAWRSPQPRTPGIQRCRPGGDVETLTTTVDGQSLAAPNDLVFGPDGGLYFTDPAQPFNPAQPQRAGRIAVLRPGCDEARTVLDVGGVYCNGIAFGIDDRLLWVESYTRAVCALIDGARSVLCVLPNGHIPDGFAVAADGRLFITSCGSHGIDIVGPHGSYEGFIPLDADANPTNCCFRGTELWITDFGVGWESGDHSSGRLWRMETDTTSAPVMRGRL
jgi:gluconolactonase